MSRNLSPRNFNYRPDISPPETCRPELFGLSPRNHRPELYSYRPEIIAQNCTVIAHTVIAQKSSPRIVQLSPIQLSPRNLSPRIVVIAQKFIAQNCTVIAHTVIAQKFIAQNCTVIAQKFIAQIQCIAQKLLFNFETNSIP